jgi:hypothetical protein
MRHVWGRRQHTGFVLGKPEAGLEQRRRIILKWILKKLYGRAWAEFNWLEIQTSGGIL